MEEKYKIMTLKYLYQLLDLKIYEKQLEDSNIESMLEENEHFKYFTLLSDGNMSQFDEEEKNILTKFDKYDINEILSNDFLTNEFIDFIKKTYKKFYFQDVKKIYKYYNGTNEEYMAPDDAFVLGLNYIISINDNYEENKNNINKLIVGIINEIQFKKAKEKELKVAVFKYNGLQLQTNQLM